MISAQNRTLPHLGADIRPVASDAAVNLFDEVAHRRRAAKVVMLDDGRWATIVTDRHRQGDGVVEVPCAGAPSLKQSGRAS